MCSAERCGSTEPNAVMAPATDIGWSAWQPLRDCWRTPTIPALPGLYRIRRMSQDAIDYIGQTGTGRMTLRRRLAMLAGVDGAVMPYRDPHTAGPALWALHQATGATFEVSVAVVEGSPPWRKALEAVAIARYRQIHGRSPTVQFGRMPRGYGMSSANNAALVRAGRRFRGGPAAAEDASHAPGTPLRSPLAGTPTDLGWCGGIWSAWLPLADAVRQTPPSLTGLYRIRTAEAPTLLYIGQGRVHARLVVHLGKARQPADEQGRIFAGGMPLEAAWTAEADLLPHQLLELENDLIAACVLTMGAPPAAQFRG